VEPETRERAYYGYQEAIVSIVVNLVLSILKFAVGIHINSIAVITDGVHSFSDIVTSVVVLLGFRSAQKPPDKEHPFGHGRFEEIISLIIAVFLIMVAVEFSITSVQRLYHPEVVKGNIFFFLLLICTIFVKEGLARYSFHLSHKIDSDALRADAWHHRSDALSSALVAFGILAARYGIYYVDSLAGIGVSVLIMYVGYSIATGSVSSLLGEAPTEEFVQKVERLARQKGVTNVSDIYVHDYGTKKVISLNVKVEPMGVEEAHAVADSIEERIAEELGSSAVVHIDGVTVDDSVKKEISSIVEEHKEVISCHAIDIGEKIGLHILVDKTMSLEKAHELAHHLGDDISLKFKKEAIIHVEPCIEQCEECSQECEKRVADQ